MTASTLDPLANALIAARRSRIPVAAAPLAELLPDAAAAYAVQDRMAGALGWFDAAPARHWKSGGPSRSAVPTHAPLPPAGVWASPARAGDWHFNLRGIEAEIALRLGFDVDAALSAGLDVDTARRLVDAMTVSIEVVDSRFAEGYAAPQLCKLADLQSHGALVLGEWVAFEACDWAAQRCRVHIGSQPLFERHGSHSLADPAFVLPAWLRHATRDGAVVARGTVVTTGTWCGILAAAAGDRVRVEFDGVGSAELQL